MNILCITHADFETPGVIQSWAKNKGYHFDVCRPYQGENPLDKNNFDILIVMGGPQSPLALDKDPYLKTEISLIQQALKDNKPILGFCLGAQLIGEALGAKTARSPEKEIGVYPIVLTEAGRQDSLLENFLETFPVIHWHNDMPGLTPKAEILAHSLGCPRQIIRYQPKVYGFQCHLEITLAGIKDMIEAVPEDLLPSIYTQSKMELLHEDYAAINHSMEQILEKFILLAGEY